jgi:[ribosomal protein S5]-alanine N-acetyltransferase
MIRPTLKTERLSLRPFLPEDADEVARMCADESVSQYIPTMPYPYTREAATTWLITHQDKADSGKELILAITEKTSARLMGSIGLVMTPEHRRAELGYWLGKEFRCHGFMTEAAKAMIDYCFSELQLEAVTCHHIKPNIASGRVMQKAGMKYEGCRRKFYFHRGNFYDILLYSVLKEEFQA